MEDGMRLRTPELVSPSAAPVLLSTDAPWQDILVVEQHRLAAQHWHESAARPYLVGMALSPPGQLEWRTADRDQDRTCEPPAGRCFFTANSPIVWRQVQEADVIVAALNPVFVDRVADALSVLGLKKLGPMSFTDIGIESILFALRTELSDGCPSGRLYGESLATALATRLVWLRERPVDHNQAGVLPLARLRQVLEYIEANLAGDTSLHRLAEIVRVGPRQFERLFVQSLGLPPHQYILRRRIAASKDLLLNSQLSLAEISDRLGFHNQSHFATTFRNKVGVAPSAFRKPQSSN
jgi:AraC family transcriptional regulator